MPPKTRSSKQKGAETKADRPSQSKKIKKEAKAADTKSKKTPKDQKVKPNKTERKKSQNKPQKSKPEMRGYTDNELKMFKQLVDEKYDEYTADQLKNLLRKNDQKVTGTKKEMIERVADGEVLGKIPRCPACFGGRLVFDYKKGVYKCPGFYDDDHFVRCKAAFDTNFIQRETWVE